MFICLDEFMADANYQSWRIIYVKNQSRPNFEKLTALSDSTLKVQAGLGLEKNWARPRSSSNRFLIDATLTSTSATKQSSKLVVITRGPRDKKFLSCLAGSGNSELVAQMVRRQLAS